MKTACTCLVLPNESYSFTFSHAQKACVASSANVKLFVGDLLYFKSSDIIPKLNNSRYTVQACQKPFVDGVGYKCNNIKIKTEVIMDESISSLLQKELVTQDPSARPISSS